MLVRCKKNYFDLELKRMVKYGEMLEVSEERGEELTTANNKSRYILCEKVAELAKAEEPGQEVQESAEEAEKVQEVAQEEAEKAEEVEEAPAKKTRKKKEV